MNQAKKIAKNVFLIGISQLITSLLGFLLLIYIARSLGETDFGKYSFAFTFTSLFAVFADIGISNLIIREIARNKGLTSVYLTNIVIIKLILSLFTIVIIILAINLLDYPSDTTYVVYLFSIYTILTSFTLTFNSIYQAFEKMEYVAIVSILDKIILIPLVLLITFLGYSIIGLAYAYVFVGFIDAIISFVIVLKQIAKPKLIVDFSIWKTLVIDSIPFAINILFAALFFRIDTIMLSVLKDDTAVGIYSAAYTPLLALSSMVSYMVTSAIYPVMSRYFISSADSIQKFAELSSRYIVMIGFPVAAGCFVLADKFIQVFYTGQYSNSIIAFQILALFIPVRLVSNITGTLLTSINRQGTRTLIVGLSALLNIFLNVAMIPYLSYLGASIATVLSEIVLYILLIHYVKKQYKKLNLHNNFIKPLIASLVMGVFVFYLPDVNLFLVISLAIITYFILLIVLKAFTQEDTALFKDIVKRI